VCGEYAFCAEHDANACQPLSRMSDSDHYRLL
jgi:hypothetical protein